MLCRFLNCVRQTKLTSSAGLIGSVRFIRQRKTGDEASSGQSRENRGEGERGRGAGTFQRFLGANKETVLKSERKLRQGSGYRRRDDDRGFFDKDIQDFLDAAPQMRAEMLGDRVDAQAKQRASRSRDYRRDDIEIEAATPEDLEGFEDAVEEEEQDGDQLRRGRRGRDDDKDRDDGSFWRWDDPHVFIPGLPSRNPDGSPVTDKILLDDDVEMRVGKLLWRRLRIEATDLDKYAMDAPSYSRAFEKGLIEAQKQLREGKLRLLAENGAALQDDKELRRLNLADTVKQIDYELGFLYIWGSMEEKLIQVRRQQAEEWGLKVDEEGDDDEEEEEDERTEGTDKEETEEQEERQKFQEAVPRVFTEEDEDAEDEAYVDRIQKVTQLPEYDPTEQQYELFSSIADHLIESGGLIEVNSQWDGQTERTMDMPMSLPRGKGLREAMELDRWAQELYKKGTPPEQLVAKSWLAVSKNTGMTEDQRRRMLRDVQQTIDRFEAERRELQKQGKAEKAKWDL